MSEALLTIRTVDALDVHLTRAGIGSRAYAFLIDWHVRLLAALTWFAVALYFLGLGVSESLERLAYAAIVPAAAIYLLYHPILEIVMQGQTPGKRWLHLRIVSTDGASPSLGALVGRNIFRLVDSLPAFYAVGLLTMLLTRDQVRIGDLAAGTLVVYDSPPSADGLAKAAVHERVPPRIAQLLEEWLERWPELDPAERDSIARTLLGRLPEVAAGEAARRLDGVTLRDHVQRLLDETRTVP